jgi:hypothetical protein
LLGESIDAAEAAYRVGYESPSQFSREISSHVWYVHTYVVVRVKVTGVEAADYVDAIETVLHSHDLYKRFESHFGPAEATEQEYAEVIVGYLVDPLDLSGEPNCSNSRYYLDETHLAGIQQELELRGRLFVTN